MALTSKLCFTVILYFCPGAFRNIMNLGLMLNFKWKNAAQFIEISCFFSCFIYLYSSLILGCLRVQLAVD